MSRVITFSRHFPKTHPKAGKPTFFVEQFFNSFRTEARGETFFLECEEELYNLNRKLEYDKFMEFRDSILINRTSATGVKSHTIRAGKRWKAGDFFSPRVWSGKPYNSRQIILAPDVEIKKVFDLKLQYMSRPFVTFKNEKGWDVSYPNGTLEKIAINDGFKDTSELDSWLLGGKGWDPVFEGQIICWNESIQY